MSFIMTMMIVVSLLVSTRLLGVVEASSLLTHKDNEPLQKAMLHDFFKAIPVSPTCIEQASSGDTTTTTNVQFQFTHPVSSYFDPSHVPFEKYNYLLEMTSTTAENSNQTWTMRIGRGGNIYSFMGAYGEAMPPQHHHDAPWNDEVWQTVTVDTRHPRMPFTYDIHQAGAYLRDGVKKPFYAPTLAVHCDLKKEKEDVPVDQCMIMSHGTHAHIATKHHNSMIYMTRYANCGEGVLEVTSLIYSHKYDPLHPDQIAKDSTVNHLVVPWGGVRRSTFQDLILTEPGDEEEDIWKVMKPMPAFKWRSSIKQIRQTAGYSIFTQSIKNPSMDEFEMPEGPPPSTEEGEDDADDDDDDEKRKHDGMTAEERRAARRAERIKQRRRLKSDGSDDDEDDKTCSPGNHTAHHSERQGVCSAAQQSSPMRIVIAQNEPVREVQRQHGSVYMMSIQPTSVVLEGHPSSPLLFRNPRTRSGFIVDAVLRWSGDDGDTLIFKCSTKTKDQINEMLLEGDVLKVSHVNQGQPKQDNLALSHVHGRNQCHPDKTCSDGKALGHTQAIARYGSGGGSHRDFVVLSVIHKDAIEPGELWMKRQYYISDSLLNLGTKSRLYNNEVWIDWMDEHSIKHELPSTPLYLFASSEDPSVIGIGIGEEESDASNSCPNQSSDQGTSLEPICTGSTTPAAVNDGHMLFAISCVDGDDVEGEHHYYVGFHMYAFDEGTDEEHKQKRERLARLHKCPGNSDSTFPRFDFLGFFSKEDCNLDGLTNAKYDPYFCSGIKDTTTTMEEVRDEL